MEKKKSQNRKTYSKGEYLPDKLVAKIHELIFANKILEYRTKNNYLQCLSIIFYHQVTQNAGLTCFVPLGSEYWKKVYGHNYKKAVISPLINMDLIESYDFEYRTFPDGASVSSFYRHGGSIGIRYRINPNLLSENYTYVTYSEKGKAITAEERILLEDEEFTITSIPDLNFHITIDVDKSSKWVAENAERICNELLKRDYVKTLPENLQIEYHEYFEIESKDGSQLKKESYDLKYSKVKKAIEKAASQGMELFYFNQSYYIAKVDEFLKHRIPITIYHYNHQISRIATLSIEEKRSPVTLRLYSQLTNFPSRILQFININNKTVVQLDLRTSQFLIFANLINVFVLHGEEHLLSLFHQTKCKTYLRRLIKILNDHQKQLPEVGVDITDRNSVEHSSSDVTRFIRDVFYRDLYSVVAHELGMKERALAKTALFKLLFKKTNRPDALLKKLSELYPIVVSMIADFKKKDRKTVKVEETYGDGDEDNRESNFSVFLQCIEAEIFVDNILKKLRDENIPSFSRHDSIVVASGYEDQAELIAKKIFQEFGFKYNHKVEDKFWEAVDLKDLEDSTYMQWLTDQDILSGYMDEEDFDNEHITKNKQEENMDEDQIAILMRLREIGFKEDYSDFIDADLLEEIISLDILTEKQIETLEQEVINIRDGISFFQKETNAIISRIILKSRHLTD